MCVLGIFFRIDLLVICIIGWECIGNDNCILCRIGYVIWCNVRSRLFCRNVVWFLNFEYYELILIFFFVVCLWGYMGMFCLNFVIGWNEIGVIV